MLQSECHNLKNDLVKVSVMHTVARMYQGKSLSTGFMSDVLYDLAGFAVYNLAIFPLIKETHANMDEGAMKEVYNTTVMISTVKIISAMLAGKDLQSQDFINDLLYSLIGFAVYDVFTKDFVDQQNFTSAVTEAIVQDTVKFGGMFAVVQLLNGGQLSDSNFVQGTVASLLGFAVANFVLAQQ